MRYTRTGIIIALIGAEIFIAGTILAVLTGGTHRAFAAPVGPSAPAAAPMTFDPIDAGPAPKVQIDDADSSVVVGVSSDGRVHVSDETRHGGLSWSLRPLAQLTVERTADGVRISRPSNSGEWFSLAGWFDQRILVDVPAGANVEIAACSGAQVSGLSGPLNVQSDDGDITASDLTGDVNVHTSDGDVKLRSVRANSVVASTNDGDISASGLQIGGGSLQSNDGSIDLSFLPSSVTIHAHTDDGSVSFDGRKSESSDDDDDSSGGDFHIGTGGGSLQVATNDGDIHILSNGAQ